MLDVVSLEHDSRGEWNAFCASSEDAWFWHTTDWLAYTLEYRPDLHGRDCSFLVSDNGRMLGVCPLILEQLTIGGRQVSEFSYAGSAGPAPALVPGLSPGHREKVWAAIMGEIDRLAAELGAERVSMRFTPLSKPVLDLPAYNPLLRHGYIDVSLLTQVIDLTQSLDAIRHGLRKGHAYDIRRGLSEMSVSAFDATSITEDTFAAYRRMHEAASGRVTRARSTFDRMEDWVRHGDGVLFGAYASEDPIGFSLVMLYGSGAYYASACNDPSRRDLPVAHVLQWEAMTWLKDHGSSLYEIGWQPSSSTPHSVPTPKELQIGSFKRGFGGTTVPLHGGEKYYSRERYLDVAAQRAAAYADMFLSAEQAE